MKYNTVNENINIFEASEKQVQFTILLIRYKEYTKIILKYIENTQCIIEHPCYIRRNSYRSLDGSKTKNLRVKCIRHNQARKTRQGSVQANVDFMQYTRT